MLWKGFQKPKRLAVDTSTLTDKYGIFWAQPFERGFGTTVGNALRYAPELLVRPRWFADYAREGLTLKAANVRPTPDGPPLTFSEAERSTSC